MKRVYIDVETTGVDPKVHALVQLAGVIVIDGEEKEAFDFKCAPFDGAVIDDTALEKTKVTREELMSRENPFILKDKFENTLARHIDKFSKPDKALFVAYNSPFDNQFVRALFDRCGDRYFGSWFWTPDICIMRKAMEALAHVRNDLPNFQLGTVAKYLGIELSEDEKLHDALYDIRLAMAVDRKINAIITERMLNVSLRPAMEVPA